MKKMALMVCLVLCLALPSTSFALLGVLDFEAAVGAWYSAPSGDLMYNNSSNTKYDLEDAFGFEEETAVSGRVKVDLPIIPVIYVMATPLEFKGNVNGTIEFNDQTFSANEDTRLKFDQYDLALYYGVPFLGLATLGTVHINGGINVRVIDVEGEVGTESMDMTIPLPMLYLSADISPIDAFSIEAEVRGLSVGYGSMISAIARLRLNTIGPFFVTAGYRYEDMSIDKDDFEADITLSGPFAELGFAF